MNYFDKAIGVLRRDGPLQLLKKGVPFIYDVHVAPHLPRTRATYNGVSVKGARYFDSILPWRVKHRPQYESGLVSGLDKNVEPGDRVVIVGGGWGVTTVIAAREAGKSGKVIVYEGSEKGIADIQETLKQNRIPRNIDIRHGVVGPLISLRGDAGKADQVSPKKIPECDVLELDCEGAEVEILKNLSILPRVILVETHGMHKASSAKVEELLEELSYSVEVKEVADKGTKDFCLEKDVYSLVAVHK